MISKVSPSELRVALELVEKMKLAGIGFVPVPYTTNTEYELLCQMSLQKLTDMVNAAEGK